MPSFHETRTAPRPAAEMFDLVADFERYPEFAPFCLAAKIRKRWTEPAGVEILIADMEVGYGSARVKFVTRDRLDREKQAISIVGIEGPFRRFEARWTFRDLTRGRSRIDFSTDYQFSSRAFDLLLAPVFGRVVSGLTRAFERRAAERPRPRPAGSAPRPEPPG